MAQVCCSKGHIYDTEIYGNSCPYCDSGAGHTIDFGTANDQMAGLGKSIAYSTVMPDDIKKTSAPTSYIREQEQLKKTVGVFAKKTGLDPIVGWLVCVEGHDKGCDYRLCAKTNSIGRGEDMDVRIKGDDTISSNLALQALNAQSAFAVSQMVLGGFWTPAEAFGAELEAHSTGDLQTMLDQLVEQALAG